MNAPIRSLALASLLLAGCSGETPPPAPAQPRAWQKLAVPTKDALPPVRGFVQARGIIHSHSPYSHDACDDHGLDAAGKPDPTCTANLRRGICDAAEDFVFLTDHADFMSDAKFEDLLYIGEGDEPIKGADGAPIGNYVSCGDGRRVLVTAGTENALMPIGLERHVPGDAEARRTTYKSDEPAAAEAMHAAGALLMTAHTESRTPEWLAAIPFDGIEVYNLHAAIDPDIREDSLGLDGLAAAAGILPFTRLDEDAPEPDLTLLGFFEDLPIYGERWDAMLATRHVTGVAGTDVHENTLPGIMRDGERGDSYRRLMRFFSNIVLVPGEVTPASVKGALAAGRSYVAFEVLGVPAGFDFHATSGSETVEMGGKAAAGAKIFVQAPKLFDPDPAVTAPELSMRVFRIAGGARKAVFDEPIAQGGVFEIPSAEPGIYRVEVRITPRHLLPYLGFGGEKYIRESLWIVSNPIRIE
ncbi:hypothetical protein [Polyangium aurulentum]|uniref:hypothetical protein n=1 Tax=Polyangium aurulentum TaxID=2567896 RepID=UPI0010AE5012|nr:hypothetical protein [Polyangium aurulentum]UQA62145.1 hypothetical protein E8A73_017420 [Polyangium aurulentum]